MNDFFLSRPGYHSLSDTSSLDSIPIRAFYYPYYASVAIRWQLLAQDGRLLVFLNPCPTFGGNFSAVRTESPCGLRDPGSTKPAKDGERMNNLGGLSRVVIRPGKELSHIIHSECLPLSSVHIKITERVVPSRRNETSGWTCASWLGGVAGLWINNERDNKTQNKIWLQMGQHDRIGSCREAVTLRTARRKGQRFGLGVRKRYPTSVDVSVVIIQHKCSVDTTPTKWGCDRGEQGYKIFPRKKGMKALADRISPGSMVSVLSSISKGV